MQAAGRGALPRGSTKSFQRGEVEEVETRVSGTRESGCEARRCDHFIINSNQTNCRPERSDPGLITLVTRSVTGVCFQFFDTRGCSDKSSTTVLHAVRRGALPRTSTMTGRKTWHRDYDPVPPERYRIPAPLSKFPGGETSITPDQVCSSRCKSESGVHFLNTLF